MKDEAMIMNQFSIGRTQSQLRTLSSLYSKTSVFLWGMLVAILIGEMLLWRIEPPMGNPFSDYADILPGEPEAMIKKEGFTCENNPNKTNYYSSDYALCTLVPQSKTFSKIEVIADHSRIVESRFYMQQNDLRYGDLMISMDVSHQIVYPRDLFFFWKSLFVRVRTVPSKLHYVLRSILSVTFSDTNDPSLSSIFPYASVPNTSNK